MDCPACHTALIVVERLGIEVDWCLECRGLWFDEGELELLGEQTGHKPNIAELGRQPGDEVTSGPRRCPRCRRKMDRVKVGAGELASVQIDRCPEHGIWLDSGELAAIMTRRKPGSDESPVLSFLGETLQAVHTNASPERRNP